MLVADGGFPGVVIQMAMRGVQIKDTTVVAEAGVLSAYLARATVDAGLAGFTWAIGLPGTIGGAVRGNAGCYGGETKDFFREMEVLVVHDVGTPSVGVEREVWSKEQCAFAYRDSALKHTDVPMMVLTATFDLPRGEMMTEKKILADILTARKEKQPLKKENVRVNAWRTTLSRSKRRAHAAGGDDVMNESRAAGETAVGAAARPPRAGSRRCRWRRAGAAGRGRCGSARPAPGRRAGRQPAPRRSPAAAAARRSRLPRS